MRVSKPGGWFQAKSFPHFDCPMSFPEARKLVEDENVVARHAFWPFLGFTDKKRRFKPDLPTKHVSKTREIKYCAHRDGYIFSYYAHLLGTAYEEYLRGSDIAQCVIGYRANLGTNVDFSKEVFDEIRKRKNCLAIALDIKDFFPSIGHDCLKKSIMKVLRVPRLSAAWFAVFKAMTKFSTVDQEELAKVLGTRPRKFKRPICSAQEFRRLRSSIPSLVKTNTDPHEIPQGAPISAVMSNVAMLEFDEVCSRFCADRKAFYRRYSDDIVIICQPEEGHVFERFVEVEIHNISSVMNISSDKTEKALFYVAANGEVSCNRPLSYLGFSFDGKRVFLRGKTISRYYRRMTYAGRSAKNAAKKNKSAVVFRRKLITQFSHLGKRNFYSYTRRAALKHGDDTPKRQLRNHFDILYEKS